MIIIVCSSKQTQSNRFFSLYFLSISNFSSFVLQLFFIQDQIRYNCNHYVQMTSHAITQQKRIQWAKKRHTALATNAQVLFLQQFKRNISRKTEREKNVHKCIIIYKLNERPFKKMIIFAMQF